MANNDALFAGSIPELYDRLLGPLLFEPYAEDLANRAARLGAKRILETAAGTGIVTQRLVRAFPADTSIIATDFNQAMLDVASAKVNAPNVTWQQCDAMHLTFPDHAVDAVICQFGVMFFPDKLVAFHEARRVLRSGGTFLFNVWDGLEQNELPQVVSEAVAAAFPKDPPEFLARTPYGYHDVEVIKGTLNAAGFKDISVEKVKLSSKAPSAQEAAIGLCQGSPLRNEIGMRGTNRLDEVTTLVADAVASRFGSGQIDVPMQAIVIAAKA